MVDGENMGKVWSFAEFQYYSTTPNTECMKLLQTEDTPQMKYTLVGVDIAKHLIQVHFIDEDTGDLTNG